MSNEEPLFGGARVLLVAASLVVVIAGLKAASQVILPFLVAVFIAVLSLPVLFFLQRRGVPSGIAVTLTILADIAVVAGIMALVGGSINELTQEIPKYEERLKQLDDTLREWLEVRGVPVSELTYFDILDPSRIFDLTQTTLRAVAAVLSNAIVVVLITVFFLFEATTFPAKIRAALGERGFEGRFRKVARELQRYLGIKTAISLATGILLGSWVAILGVDFALLWGLTAFALNYIPNLGSIIAAIPPTLLALIQLGPGSALVVGLGYVAVNVLLGNLLEPQLMGRRLGLSTLVVFLSLVFWGWVWGPVGMLLSVPLTMIVKILLENTEDLRWISVLLGSGSEPFR